MNILGFNTVSSITSPNSTPVSQPQTSSQPSAQSIYGSDSVSILTRSTNELSVFAGGALAGYKYHDTLGTVAGNIGTSIKGGNVKDMLGALTDGTKTLGTTALNGAGVGALVAGGTALVTNALSVVTGRKDIGDASADVVGTTIKGAVGGAGGVIGGGLLSGGMSLLGFAGTPLVIAGVIGGVVGAAMANKMLNTSSVDSRIRSAFA